MNRRTDEAVGKGAKAKDRTALKVSEVVVLKAHQLNSIRSPFTFRIKGRGVV
jgi:hypothetical protein